MPKQKYLRQNGEIFYPVSHTKSTYDNNGKVLEDRLVEMKNGIDNHSHTAEDVGALPVVEGKLIGDLRITNENNTEEEPTSIYLGADEMAYISEQYIERDDYGGGSCLSFSADLLEISDNTMIIADDRLMPLPPACVECTTGATAENKNITPHFFRQVKDVTIRVKFKHAHTSNTAAKLKIYSNVIPIVVPKRDGISVLEYIPVTSANTWEADEIVDFLYDGEKFIAISSTGNFVSKNTFRKYATFVIGTSTSGYTASDVDYLCDGVDDQAEINAAISSLPSNGGKIVLLEGTYNISGYINMNKANTCIEGMGMGCTTIQTTTVSVLFNIQSGDKQQIRNLSVVKNDSTGYGTAIKISSVKNCFVQGVEVTGFEMGIQAENSQYLSCDVVHVSSNTYGIYLGGINCTVCHCKMIDNQYGIHGGAGNRNIITANQFINNDIGITLPNCENNKVSNNYIIRGTGQESDYTDSQHSIMIGRYSKRNLISDNYIFGKNYVNSGDDSNTFVSNVYQ